MKKKEGRQGKKEGRKERRKALIDNRIEYTVVHEV